MKHRLAHQVGRVSVACKQGEARLLRFIEARPGRACLAFVALWLVVHTLVTLGYYERFIDYETLKYGYMAKDLDQGFIADIRAYQYFYREGSALVIGFIVYPFFELLGPSIFALHLAGAWFMGLGSWPWVDLARRIAGPRGAVAMALVLLLPFPFYLRMTVTLFSIVTHLGVIIFAGISALMLYRGFVDRSLSGGVAALGAGLACGLGCWWAFSFWAIAVGIGLGVLVLRVGVSRILIFAAGCLPGLVTMWFACLGPLFDLQGGLLNAISEGKVRVALVASEGDGVPNIATGGRLTQVWKLLTYHFPRAAGFVPEGDHPQNIVVWPSVLYYLGFLGCLAALVILARRKGHGEALRALAILSLPVPAYFAVYLASGIYADTTAFDQYRYFLPVVPFAFLVVSVAHAHVHELVPKLGFRATFMSAAVLVVLGVVSVSNVFDWSMFPTPNRFVKGYNVFFIRGRSKPPQLGLQMKDRTDYQPLAYRLGLNEGLDELQYERSASAEVEGLSELLWSDYWEGFGASYRYLLHKKKVSDAYLEFVISSAAIEKAHAIVRGMVLGDFRYRDIVRPLDWPKTVAGYARHTPEARRDRIMHAVYSAMGEAVIKDSPVHKGDPLRLRKVHRDAFVEGMARGFGRDILSDRRWPREAPFMRNTDRMRGGRSDFWRLLESERLRLRRIETRLAEQGALNRPVRSLPRAPLKPYYGH